MKTLTNNITNLFGEKGKIWLNNLPEITNKLSEIFNLSDLSAYNNLSYNYLLKGFQTRENKTKKTKYPIALKISYEQNMIQDEINALKHFNGRGCVAIISDNSEYHALLLEQVIPGTTLKSHYLENIPESIDNSMDYYADIINDIKDLPLPKKHNFRHIKNWLGAIDKIKITNSDNKDKIPEYLLDKAIDLKNHLLNSTDKDLVLHGDLHQDNILKNKNKYIAIDPKGIIGEIGFEAAKFDFIQECELDNLNNIPDIYKQRISLLADKLNFDYKRLSEWVFVRMILGAAWFIEDNCDPSKSLIMAENVYKILD